MRSAMYYALKSEGLVNTDAPSLKELIPSEFMFKLFCNNPYKCARATNSKHGALIVKKLSNPHKHKSCPVCGDSRVIVMPHRVYHDEA